MYIRTQRALAVGVSAKILVELGIYPSISEIRRNKPNLMVSLDRLDFLDNLKISKKRRLWILVGE